MKIVLGLLLLLLAQTAYSFSFNFKIFNGNRGIKNYGTYRAWEG